MQNDSQTRIGRVTGAVLLPHAPILVPEVGGGRGAGCRKTMEAMATAARRLLAGRPDSVVLLSPHAERGANAFAVSLGRVEGSLARFGAAGAAVQLPGDAEWAEGLRRVAANRGIPMVGLDCAHSDHGTVVPLWYLVQAGWSGPTVVIALTWDGNSRVGDLGECVAEAAGLLGRRVAVVASGDMSHRLKPGAPCGYDPRARNFDEEFMAALGAGTTRELPAVVSRWRECAAEDALDSTLFALGAAGWCGDGREVLGYEGPFGVGYGVAVLFDATAARSPETGRQTMKLGDLPGLARASVAAALGRPVARMEPESGTLPGDNGVFVTLLAPDGKLRGCIGTTRATSGDLARETWRMAREAALHDPRFSPVRAEELDGLRIEVTVLDPPEDIDSEDSLDPRRWGVIVRAADGRRGLLLPDLPTVTTVAQQLTIARAKARIGPAEPVTLQRFGARLFAEEAQP